MFRRNAATALLATGAFLTLILAQAASAPSSVTLRYRFHEGQEARYRLDDDSTMSSQSLPADMLPKTHAEFVYKMTVRGVRGSDGAATVEYDQQSSSLTLNGEPSAMPEGSQSATSLTCVMLPTGQVLSSSAGGASSADPGADDPASALAQSAASFPKAAVKVGDTWSSALSPSTSGGLSGTVQYQLLSIAMSGADTVAKIKTVTDASFQQSAPGGLAFSGHVDSDGVLTFDVTLGRIESSVETSHVALTPAGGGSDMPVPGFDVESHSTLRRAAS